MQSVDMDDLLAIARSLNQLRIRYAFTGGAILGFLLDNPHLPFPRTTDDVDAIVEVVTRIEYTRLEERLRKEAGFKNDTSQGAPLCRWLAGNTRVDIMPIHDQTGNFSDLWFDYALERSSVQLIKGVPVSKIPAQPASHASAAKPNRCLRNSPPGVTKSPVHEVTTKRFPDFRVGTPGADGTQAEQSCVSRRPGP